VSVICHVDVDDRLARTAEANHHLVTPAQVEAVGMSARQWRYRRDSGEWLEIAPQVWRHRMTGVDWQLQARAGVMSLGRHAALHGRTAAAWWELGGVTVAEPEFVVPRSGRHRRFPYVVHTTEQWAASDLLVRDGVRVTTATRTVIDLAGGPSTADEIERVIDDGMQRRLTSLPTLRRRIAELGGPGRTGSSLLRALLLDSGGESFLERRFLRLVRRAGLPRPRCQVVHRAGTAFVARVDFQFPATMVIVEVSGRLGHVSNRDRQRDARRRNALQAAGYIVLEYTTADVLDEQDYVIASLRSELLSRVIL
jgi:very-short-patch-repair endonuclease